MPPDMEFPEYRKLVRHLIQLVRLLIDKGIITQDEANAKIRDP